MDGMTKSLVAMLEDQATRAAARSMWEDALGHAMEALRLAGDDAPDGLVAIRNRAARNLAVRAMGSKGGKVSTPKKRAAARANGAKGGRPRTPTS